MAIALTPPRLPPPARSPAPQNEDVSSDLHWRPEGAGKPRAQMVGCKSCGSNSLINHKLPEQFPRAAYRVWEEVMDRHRVLPPGAALWDPVGGGDRTAVRRQVSE